MKHSLMIAALVAGSCSTNLFADATLTYELSGSEMEPRSKILSISRFFVRVDDPAEPDSFLLYQTGRFFPLYRVDQTNLTYTRLTQEGKPVYRPSSAQAPEQAPRTPPPETSEAATPDPDAAQPQTQGSEVTATQIESVQAPDPVTETAADKAETSLRLTNKRKEIAGVRCLVVEELAEGRPIMTHCMADKARLGITEREIRTLVRLFKMARERNFDWLGTATPDENFVSVASHDLQSSKRLQLKSRSTEPLPAGYLSIPREYKEVQD